MHALLDTVCGPVTCQALSEPTDISSAISVICGFDGSLTWKVGMSAGDYTRPPEAESIYRLPLTDSAEVSDSRIAAPQSALCCR